MSQKTEDFFKQCAKNQKQMADENGYTAPAVTDLDLDEINDARGASATSTTTTGAAVACAVSAVF